MVSIKPPPHAGQGYGDTERHRPREGVCDAFPVGPVSQGLKGEGALTRRQKCVSGEDTCGGEKRFVWDGDHYYSPCHWSVRVAGTAPGPGRIQTQHFITSRKVLQRLPEDFGIKSRRFLGTSNKILCPCCPSFSLGFGSSIPAFLPHPLPISTPTKLTRFL